MKKITTLEFDLQNNASFVAYFSRAYQPWINNTSLTDSQRETKVPAILMLNRWDGRVGFAGGNVDSGENLFKAACRESFEEINHKVIEKELTPICTHKFEIGSKTLSTHLFAKEVSNEELFSIQQNIHLSRDYGDEILGSVICLVGDFSKGKGFPTFFKTPMATSVKEELIELIYQEELIPVKELENICLSSGFSLDQLLLK